MANKILSGIMGLVVGDALGVPVEFQSRESLKRNPVKEMRAYGTYNQPAGTWSDDSSMTLALVDSLKDGLSYDDIMDKFLHWYEAGGYTPHGVTFDVGIATSQALARYRAGASPLEAGGTGERDNGNGSLMRILPLLYYLQENFGEDFSSKDEAYEIIHDVSSLTHRHKRSQIACGIYLSIANELSATECISKAVESGLFSALSYYKKKPGFTEELDHFSRLEDKNFKDLSEEEIGSSGYVVDTLEASIWCLLTTSTYEKCVLKAVNLGNDTDTTGAVAGSLAGIYYGYEAIPEDWLKTIVRRDYVEGLCDELFLGLRKKDYERLIKHRAYLERASREGVCSWKESRKDERGAFIVPYPVYDKEFMDFINDFYCSGLKSQDYVTIVSSRTDSLADIENHIVGADLELLGAIFTTLVRQERFDDGIWEIAVKEGLFLIILDRLGKLLGV